MNVFKTVSERITAKAAAVHYGLTVGRNGMACCPFHPDKHPSMKLDQRFHCFGCGADGDAVNYVARIFGLNNYDAAIKLLDDFGIPYEMEAGKKKKLRKAKTDKRTEHELRIRKVEKQFRNWLSYAEDILLKYEHLLREWKENYRPETPDAEWHPLFAEALQMQTLNEYHLDILYGGTEEDRLDFFVRKRRR